MAKKQKQPIFTMADVWELRARRLRDVVARLQRILGKRKRTIARLRSEKANVISVLKAKINSDAPNADPCVNNYWIDPYTELVAHGMVEPDDSSPGAGSNSVDGGPVA